LGNSNWRGVYGIHCINREQNSIFDPMLASFAKDVLFGIEKKMKVEENRQNNAN
jgi:hypothetical protein